MLTPRRFITSSATHSNSTRKNNSLGQICLSSTKFINKGKEVLVYYVLDEKYLLLSMTQGEIGLKIYYVDEEALSSPPLLSSSMAIKITEPKKVEETPLPLLNITRKLKQ